MLTVSTLLSANLLNILTMLLHHAAPMSNLKSAQSSFSNIYWVKETCFESWRKMMSLSFPHSASLTSPQFTSAVGQEVSLLGIRSRCLYQRPHSFSEAKIDKNLKGETICSMLWVQLGVDVSCCCLVIQLHLARSATSLCDSKNKKGITIFSQGLGLEQQSISAWIMHWVEEKQS